MAAASEPYFSKAVQRRLIADVTAPGPLASALEKAMSRSVPTIVLSEQQLMHLARLVVLHADPRPHDDFGNSEELYSEWLTCLFGVTDLLDAGLRVEDHDERLSWELRQYNLNHHEDGLPVLAVHYEIYRELWPRLDSERAKQIEAAFTRHTRMRIADYFAVGAAVQARFIAYGLSETGLAAISPAEYFGKAQLSEDAWKPFFDLVARDLAGLRTELKVEDERYGPTTYGALTFERFPLFRAEPGLYLPLSVLSLMRRVTEGVFHFLSAAAEAEALDRRHYISPFGDLFQQLVEWSFRRGVEASGDAIPIAADIEYGPRSARRRSSDVILGYDGYPVFVEVVSGPLQVGTTTRGDLTCFQADLERLVLGKARQLDASIRDFLTGELRLDGCDPTTSREVWPVIVTSHAFPSTGTVSGETERQVDALGYLTSDRIAPLAVISAEELCFCEGFMERGKTFLSLIRGWKSGPESSYSFKNYLVALGDGKAPASEHAKLRFAQASADYFARLFGFEGTAEEVLAELRRPDA
jgi:hypothetical protein